MKSVSNFSIGYETFSGEIGRTEKGISRKIWILKRHVCLVWIQSIDIYWLHTLTRTHVCIRHKINKFCLVLFCGQEQWKAEHTSIWLCKHFLGTRLKKMLQIKHLSSREQTLLKLCAFWKNAVWSFESNYREEYFIMPFMTMVRPASASASGLWTFGAPLLLRPKGFLFWSSVGAALSNRNNFLAE